MKENRLGSIDYAKFIFSILIIGLHTSVLSDISNNLAFFVNQVIARFAVPFFFITSGYFMSLKIISNENANCINMYAKKYLNIFLIFSLLYFPLTFYWNYNFNEHLIINIFNYLQKILFMAPAYLWYLVALIFGIMALKILTKIPSYISIVIVILIYFIGVLGNSYIYLFNMQNVILCKYFQVFLTTRNGFFFATPFIYFGYLIAKYSLPFKKKKIALFLLLSLMLYTTEVYYVHSKIIDTNLDTSMYFFLLPTSIFLFLFIKGLNITSSRISSILSNMSLSLYILQFGFISIMILINKYLLIGDYKITSTIMFIITLFGGISVYFLYQKLFMKRQKTK